MLHFADFVVKLHQGIMFVYQLLVITDLLIVDLTVLLLVLSELSSHFLYFFFIVTLSINTNHGLLLLIFYSF